MDYCTGILWRRVLMVTIFLCASMLAQAANTPGLKFIENKNQWPSPINFSARIPGGAMFIQPGQFTYYFLDHEKLDQLHERSHGNINESDGKTTIDESITGYHLQVNFLGSNPYSIPNSFGNLSTYYNYFIGSDSCKWASKANSYEGVYYTNFYQNIDLKVYSIGSNLKYDYIVLPGGDASKIRVQYLGADGLQVMNGDLQIKTALGDITEKAPYAYQNINGKTISVKCTYALRENILSFIFPDGYDACYELTIDPLLIFSTYSGSTADNWGSTATPGEHGNLYSSGVTNQFPSGKFPTTPGVFQTKYGGLYDVAILKYDSSGQHLLYASYLGGNDSESPHSLIMNKDEELIVLGTTSSLNFPTSNTAFDKTYNGGSFVPHVVLYDNGSDIFIARISKDGGTLLSSTYLGGSENDGLNVDDGGLVRNYGDHLRGDIITDDDNNIYISSVTSSVDFPVSNSFDLSYNGGFTDAVLMKLDASLSQVLWATFIGGSGTDASHTLKLDKNRNIYLAGGTNSTNFPTTAGSYQMSVKGEEDGWVAKVSGSGSSIKYATLTGTTSFDQVYFLDLQGDGVFVYGQTTGSFTISSGVYSNSGSGQFLQKFDSTLSKSIFSTVFGSGRGIPDISPTAFLVNDCGNIYMSGWGGVVNQAEGFWNSDTKDLPVSNDAYQRTTSGSDFYFIVLTDNASSFLYGTYLGGTDSRTHLDGGTCRFDKNGIVYHAVCSGCAAFNDLNHSTSDFPTTKGAWSRTNNSQNCNNAAFKFDLSVLKAHIQTNTVALNMPGYNHVCMPDSIVFQNRCIGGQIYEWNLGDGTSLTKTDTSAVVHQYKAEGKYIVKLKVIDQRTCTERDSTFTTVNVFQLRSKAQNDDALCEHNPYTLKATGAVLYNWTSTDTLFTATNNQSPTVHPKDTTTYFVTMTEASGCIRKDTVKLSVIPDIGLDFELKRINNCFSRTSVEVIDKSTKTKSDDHLFFDFGDGKTSDGTDVKHDYASDNIYHVKLVGAREFCVTEKSFDVPIYVIKVPNVITPDGSPGVNDKFIIEYGEKPGSTPADFGIKAGVVIYNRWGRQVFKADDYQYNWGGEGLAAGVYFYEVTIEGQATCKSWVQVIK